MPDESQPPDALNDALEATVRAHARWEAALDLNDLYVALTENLDVHVVDPVALEQQLPAKHRVSDDFAVYLSRCYRDSYRDALNDSLEVISATDTPGEKAMASNLDQVGLTDPDDLGWDVDLARVRRLRDLAYPTQPAHATRPTEVAMYVPTLIVGQHSTLAPKDLYLGNGDPTQLGYLPPGGTGPEHLANQGWSVDQAPAERAARNAWLDRWGETAGESFSRRCTPPREWWVGFVAGLEHQHTNAVDNLAWLARLQPDQLPSTFIFYERPDRGALEVATQGRHLVELPPMDRTGGESLGDYLRGDGWRNIEPLWPQDNGSATVSPGPTTHANLTRALLRVKDTTAAALTAITADAASQAALEALHHQQQPGRVTHDNPRPRPGGRIEHEGPEQGSGR